jgi:hypothetical protein
MKKRVIEKDKYSMVIDWSKYENTHTLLPCKCDMCGEITFKTINTIDYYGHCHCEKCGRKEVSKIKANKVEHDNYPMVISWDNYKNTKTKLLCKCTECDEQLYLSIKELNKYNEGRDKFICKCKKCQVIQRKKTLIEKYGVENPSQSFMIQKKKEQTTMRKYGVFYLTQRNRKKWQIEVTSSKENLEAWLISLGKKITILEGNSLLGFGKTQFWNYIKKWDLYEYINSIKSSSENELREYIESLGFITKTKRINNLEIDIFISEKSVGFEFNGSYWHSDKIKKKNYHYNKTTIFQNNDIRIIHIWEHEWVNEQERIKSYIKSQLGLYEKHVFAKECEVKEIDSQIVMPLLEYHQQEITPNNIYIGLFHNEELVLMMSFSMIDNKWNVKEDICKDNYNITDGKSKVFNYFVDKYEPQNVTVCVDRSKFTGKSYQNMGFKLDHINPSKYDWVYRNSLIFKKHQPEIYDEMENLHKEGKVFKIYDAGEYCYIWRKNT